MRTLSLQLIAAAALLMCTGCQACFDSIYRFEVWKTEKCCNLFHCHRPAAPAVIYAPIAAPIVQQQCQPQAIAAAPCAQAAPICAPIQCDPCANSANSVSSAAPCCQQSTPCCPPPCCPPVCCVNECSPCGSSYGNVSYGSGDCGCNSTSGGVIVNEQPYRDGGTTIQNTPNLAPGPAAIGR